MCLTNIFFSIERVSAPIQAIGKATIAAGEFFAVIDAPLPPRGLLKHPEVSATKDIVFDQVTFAYPSRPDIRILDDVNLRFGAGKTTAIVGPSGSGKSTIVGLIEHWYNLSHQHVIPKSIAPKKDEKTKGEVDVDDLGLAETEELKMGHQLICMGLSASMDIQ